MQEQVIDIAKRILGKAPVQSTVTNWCTKGLGTTGKLKATRIEDGRRVYWMSDYETVKEFLSSRVPGNRSACIPDLIDPGTTFPPDTPCPYPRGSKEKVEFLAARYRASEPLWNPLDSTEIVQPLDGNCSKKDWGGEEEE